MCHGVPHKPSQFVDSQASLSVCLVQLLPRTTPFLVDAQYCFCSIMMTDEDSSSHATCKRADTVFSNFTKPNFLSKLRHWLSPSSTSSPHFTRSSIFADPHFVHDLRCEKGSQLSSGLSSAMRTLVFCSAEILRVLHCRFTSLTAISTRPFTSTLTHA